MERNLRARADDCHWRGQKYHSHSIKSIENALKKKIEYKNKMIDTSNKIFREQSTFGDASEETGVDAENTDFHAPDISACFMGTKELYIRTLQEKSKDDTEIYA